MNMKSLAELIRVLYRGVLDDAAATFPDEALNFERDYSRIEVIVEQNEIGFFTLFLPTFAKHLTRCLDEGLFVSFPGPNMKTARGVVYPRLFSGLTKQIFREDGLLHEVNDRTTTAIMLLQTCLSGCKKLRMECSDEAVRTTVQSFVDTEEVVRPYSLNWGADVLRCEHGLSIVGDEAKLGKFEAGNLFAEPLALPAELLSSGRAVQQVADRIFSGFGSPFDRDLQPRHGPGAIADRAQNASKYQFRNWPAKLEQCFPSDLFGQPNGKLGLHAALVETSKSFFSLDDEAVVRNPSRFIDEPVASKLIAVPKTQKGPRLIAAEPVANMWMQQSLLGFITDAVARSPLQHCVDFKDQRKSGRLALESSLSKSHSTIDLSDASDRLSCWLVERMFRSNYDLLQAFNAVRTDVVSIPIEFGTNFPRMIRLKKFSTQGSALTFPVQTVVYAVICIGVLIDISGGRVTARTIKDAAKKVRLYGDDIITPTEITGRVIEMLEALGFKVNQTKTFRKGNFRESCGVDGYMGVDVTPSYVLEPYDVTSPSSVVSLVECCNNFYMKGMWRAAERLKSTIAEEMLERIPVVRVKQGVNGEWYRAGSFGFVSMMGFSFGRCNYRWSDRYHCLEAKLAQPVSKVEKVALEEDYALLQYFTEVPSLTEPEKASWTGLSAPQTNPWSSGEARRPKLAMKLRWVPVETLDVGKLLPMMNR